MSEDYDENHGLAKEKEARYRLEGALGYALRIAKSIQDKKVKSIEELTKLIEEDFKGIIASLSFHCRDDLKIAGFGAGLFDDELTQKASNTQEKIN